MRRWCFGGVWDGDGRVIADAVRLEDELRATTVRFAAVKAELDEMI